MSFKEFVDKAIIKAEKGDQLNDCIKYLVYMGTTPSAVNILLERNDPKLRKSSGLCNGRKFNPAKDWRCPDCDAVVGKRSKKRHTDRYHTSKRRRVEQLELLTAIKPIDSASIFEESAATTQKKATAARKLKVSLSFHLEDLRMFLKTRKLRNPTVINSTVTVLNRFACFTLGREFCEKTGKALFLDKLDTRLISTDGVELYVSWLGAKGYSAHSQRNQLDNLIDFVQWRLSRIEYHDQPMYVAMQRKATAYHELRSKLNKRCTKAIKKSRSIESLQQRGAWMGFGELFQCVERGLQNIVPDMEYNMFCETMISAIYIDERPPRPGLLSNITIRDFMAAKLSNDKIIDCTAFKNSDTKTYRPYKLGESSINLIEFYLANFRPVQQNDLERLFVTRSGAPLNISNCVSSFFKRQNPDKNMTATILRSIVETEAVRGNFNGGNFGALLEADHNSTTSKMYYQKLSQREKHALADVAYANLKSGLDVDFCITDSASNNE